MPETGVDLGRDEISALLLKSHSGGRLTKEERKRLNGICQFCRGGMIPGENSVGMVCEDCGRCSDHIQCS